MSRIMDQAPMVFLLAVRGHLRGEQRLDYKARGDEYINAWDMKLK